jgi:catechol 2,3-dioxygenase-like lactoylglutathione lyase family enzyme
MKLAYASVIARDIDALCDYYAAVLEAPVLVDHATPIYRAIDLGGTTLAFSAEVVYDLLGIGAWTPEEGTAATREYLTFGVDSEEELESRTKTAVAAGGQLLKGPYDTSYGAYQTVIADPEGNVFRLNYARP